MADPIQRLLARETRPAHPRQASHRLLLAYPAPHRVGMSSLGFLTLHREVSHRSGWSVERVFLQDEAPDRGSLRAWETGDPASRFAAVGVSVAHELDVARVAALLHGLGLSPRRGDRSPKDPLVVLGGPLTAINPRPLAALADLVVVGEADQAIHVLCDALEQARDLDELQAHLGQAGFWWPDRGEPPPAQHVPDDRLPAWSELRSPDAELRDMALVEVSRGCPRNCAFCATSRQSQGGARIVDSGRILDRIPREAHRVGLVGAAVSEHPELREILARLVDDHHEVGLSSIRADQVDDELLDLLCRGGLRTLTLGVDGLSERVRRSVKKGLSEETIVHAAEAAARADLRRLKLYQLVGLPGETDQDLHEFVALCRRLVRLVPLTLTLNPFVPKPGTPLSDAGQFPVKEVERRLRLLRAGLGGRARVQPVSARWAAVEAAIARGDEHTGELILEAWEQGGRFADFRRVFALSGS